MKKESDDKTDPWYNNTNVVIGAILGSVDGKMIDISNQFPLPIKTEE